MSNYITLILALSLNPAIAAADSQAQSGREITAYATPGLLLAADDRRQPKRHPPRARATAGDHSQTNLDSVRKNSVTKPMGGVPGQHLVSESGELDMTTEAPASDGVTRHKGKTNLQPEGKPALLEFQIPEKIVTDNAYPTGGETARTKGQTDFGDIVVSRKSASGSANNARADHPIQDDILLLKTPDSPKHGVQAVLPEMGDEVLLLKTPNSPGQNTE